MTEEDKNVDETTEAPEAEAAEAPAEAATEEAPAQEQPEAEPAAEEAPAEEQPEAEPAAEAADTSPPAGDEEEAETPSAKQLRKAARSRASGRAKPQRSIEERATERGQRRQARTQARRRHRAANRGAGEPGQGTPPLERRPAERKVRQGIVVSNKAEKTITVRFEVARRHPVYEKVVRRTATLHAHDEGNEANEGDVVRVVESRPVSKTKRWRLAEVLERAR